MILYGCAVRGKGGFCTVVQPEGKGGSVRWCGQGERGIRYGGAARGKRGFCTVVQPEEKGDSVRWCSQRERGILYGGAVRGKGGFDTVVQSEGKGGTIRRCSHRERGIRHRYSVQQEGTEDSASHSGAARGKGGFCITHWCGQREGGIVHPTVVHPWGGGFCTSLWCSQRERGILHTSCRGAARRNGGLCNLHPTSVVTRGNGGQCNLWWCSQRERGILHPTVVHPGGGGILHPSVVKPEGKGNSAPLSGAARGNEGFCPPQWCIQRARVGFRTPHSGAARGNGGLNVQCASPNGEARGGGNIHHPRVVKPEVFCTLQGEPDCKGGILHLYSRAIGEEDSVVQSEGWCILHNSETRGKGPISDKW